MLHLQYSVPGLIFIDVVVEYFCVSFGKFIAWVSREGEDATTTLPPATASGKFNPEVELTMG